VTRAAEYPWIRTNLLEVVLTPLKRAAKFYLLRELVVARQISAMKIGSQQELKKRSSVIAVIQMRVSVMKTILELK